VRPKGLGVSPGEPSHGHGWNGAVGNRWGEGNQSKARGAEGSGFAPGKAGDQASTRRT
jgi:hypothetical protein